MGSSMRRRWPNWPFFRINPFSLQDIICNPLWWIYAIVCRLFILSNFGRCIGEIFAAFARTWERSSFVCEYVTIGRLDFPLKSWRFRPRTIEWSLFNDSLCVSLGSLIQFLCESMWPLLGLGLTDLPMLFKEVGLFAPQHLQGITDAVGHMKLTWCLTVEYCKYSLSN